MHFTFLLDEQLDSEANAAILDRCHCFLCDNSDLVRRVREKLRDVQRRSPDKLTTIALAAGINAVISRCLKQRCLHCKLSCSPLPPFLLILLLLSFLFLTGLKPKKRSIDCSSSSLVRVHKIVNGFSRSSEPVARLCHHHSLVLVLWCFCSPFFLPAANHAATKALGQSSRPSRVQPSQHR